MEGTRMTAKCPFLACLLDSTGRIQHFKHAMLIMAGAVHQGFFSADTYVPYFRFSDRSAHWIALPDSSGCYCLGRVPRLAAPPTFARVDGYAYRRRDLQRPRAA